MEYIKINLPNDYLNDIIELELFQFKDKDALRFSANHESLEKLQREKMKDIDFSLTVHAATEKYAAVQVTLKDAYGRCVSEVADVNTYHLMATDNKDYYKAHPLVAAKNNAFDAAVRKFLGLPRTFEPDTCPELEAFLAAHPELIEEEESTPEPADTPSDEVSTDQEITSDNDDYPEVKEEKRNPYGDLTFAGGKYAGMTYAVIYAKDPDYFKRAKNWKGYETVNSFLEAMKEE